MKPLSLWESYKPFNLRILTFTGWNEKCQYIIWIKIDLSGFVFTMHLGLCEQTVHQIPRPNSLRILLPASYMPSCFVTTKPSSTSVNPLNNFNFSLISIDDESMRFGRQCLFCWSLRCYKKNNVYPYSVSHKNIGLHSLLCKYIAEEFRCHDVYKHMW